MSPLYYHLILFVSFFDPFKPLRKGCQSMFQGSGLASKQQIAVVLLSQEVEDGAQKAWRWAIAPL
jgi:hypothetical protein